MLSPSTVSDRGALRAENVPAQSQWFARALERPVRILIIQRDNIGDLVLSTPFIQALRACFDASRLDILVNSYNEAVVARNPDIDHTYRYVKAKHRSPGQSLLSVYWETGRTWQTLRANGYDLAILMAGRFSRTSLRPARVAGAVHIAGFVDRSTAATRLDLGVVSDAVGARHVVERSASLLEAIVPPALRERCWPADLPACRVFPDPVRVADIRARRQETLGKYCRLVIGVHISARKVDQRLSAAKFAALMQVLHARTGCGFMLFWAPGGSANPLHPGDDTKAEEVLALTTGLPVFPHATLELPELIAGLGLPHLLVCSDGGAMHLAAAQQIPTVALFGNSDPEVWHPWGSRHEILRAATEKVEDLAVDSMATAALRMLRLESPPGAAGQP